MRPAHEIVMNIHNKFVGIQEDYPDVFGIPKEYLDIDYEKLGPRTLSIKDPILVHELQTHPTIEEALIDGAVSIFEEIGIPRYCYLSATPAQRLINELGYSHAMSFMLAEAYPVTVSAVPLYSGDYALYYNKNNVLLGAVKLP